MRPFYFGAILFIFFLGINGIVRWKRYADTLRNGHDAEVTVLRKNIGSHGVKQLKVSSKQQVYWLDVADSTYLKAELNKRIILQYDAEHNRLIDDKVGSSYMEIAASVIFLIFAGILCLLYKKAF